MIKICEILAFILSVTAFGYGAFMLFRKGMPKYFQLYVCASGCYMLEELWVIVNSLFGNGSQDGLLTVRILGFFGCLCFMLSANANEFDKVVDEGKNKKAKAIALTAPALLLVLFAFYAFSPANTLSPAINVIELLSISPGLFAAYFSLKHLFLPTDKIGYLKLTRSIDIAALVFFGTNYVYPLADLYIPKTVMSLYDLILAVILFVIIAACRRGAVKWKALI